MEFRNSAVKVGLVKIDLLYRLSSTSFYILDRSLDLSGFFVVVDNYDFQGLESGEEFVDFLLGVVVMR